MKKIFIIILLMLILSTTVGNAAVVNVIIDNTNRARPQSGLDQALVVYELVVSPGVTRLMGVFALNQDVEKLGPVRSARMPFLNIALGHRGVFVHAGASTPALYALPSAPIIDLDEIYNAQNYFYRIAERSAPHNLYTDMDLIRQGLLKRPPVEEISFPYSFGNKPDLSNQQASSFSLQLKWQREELTFFYDDFYGGYLKYNAGSLMVTDQNQPLIFQNVVVIKAPYLSVEVTPNGEIKAQADIIGTGTASFYRDGLVYQGQWSKESPTSPFKFTVANQEMIFSPGSIYIIVNE